MTPTVFTVFTSVCAWGRDAHLHSKGYDHLLAVDGWVLLIGVGIDRCSSLHLAERAMKLPEEISRIFRVPEDIRRDYPPDMWSIGYGSTPADPWMKVWEEAQRRGLARESFIGQARCCLFKAKAMVSLYGELYRADPFALFGLEGNAGS